MDTIQGIEYVKSVAGIDPANMSKAMFKFVRAAARAANRSMPIETRPEVLKFRFAPFVETKSPAQERFAAYVLKNDPYMDPCMWGF